MSRRVSPIESIRAPIDELFASDRELGPVLEEVGRLSVRLMMQTAIEAEVDAFLARQRYERREDEAPAGYRNGHQPAVAIRTTMGAVEIARPKLRDTDERFCSQLFGTTVTRTSALEALASRPGWGGCPTVTSRRHSPRCSAPRRPSAARA